jgi:DNA-binding NarL/FixJ family response regulator
MEVVGEAGDGEAALKMVRELTPDMVLMDISMPGMNGLKATKKLRQICPQVKILTLTRHTDDGYLQQLIGAGANGYVLKQSAPSELINAIRSVRDGNSYLDPALTEKVMGGYVSRAASKRGETKGGLSARESEVVRLIAWGYSNKEIAGRLDLSVKTIEAHKSNAMRKLDIGSRIDIVRYAILQGWLQDN